MNPQAPLGGRPRGLVRRRLWEVLLGRDDQKIGVHMLISNRGTRRTLGVRVFAAIPALIGAARPAAERNRWARKLLSLGLVSTLLSIVGVGLSASSASASVRYCGIATCTDYSSKTQVRNAAASIRAAESRVGDIWSVSCGAMSAAAGVYGAAVTGPLGLAAGPVAWIGCEALRGKYGSITGTITAAADNGQCVAISFARYGSNNLAFATGWWRYSCNWN